LERYDQGHLWHVKSDSTGWVEMMVEEVPDSLKPTIRKSKEWLDQLGNAHAGCSDCETYDSLQIAHDTIGSRPVSIERARLSGTLGHLEYAPVIRIVAARSDGHWVGIQLSGARGSIEFLDTIAHTIKWRDWHR
jgi:hypothetical protein